jgi:predicted Zn-dependent protease
VRSLIGNGAEIMGRSLDKQAEFEADRMGVVLAARAGYDPFGLPAVLQDLTQFASDDGAVSLLFKTHPRPEDRLTQLAAAMGDRFDRLGGATLQGRLYRLKR